MRRIDTLDLESRAIGDRYRRVLARLRGDRRSERPTCRNVYRIRSIVELGRNVLRELPRASDVADGQLIHTDMAQNKLDVPCRRLRYADAFWPLQIPLLCVF